MVILEVVPILRARARRILKLEIIAGSFGQFFIILRARARRISEARRPVAPH